MNRRRHHHPIQPYDFDRLQTREPARGIEYQDDSLSSINSDEETYLPRSHLTKETKIMHHSGSKSHKPERSSSQSNAFHQKADKVQQTYAKSESIESDPTAKRLERLESMLQEFMKRNTSAVQQPASSSHVEKYPVAAVKVDRTFLLEPRRHDFTTSMWINKIQEVSIQGNWGEKTTVQFMEGKMSGIIKAWYNSLPNYDFTWPEWKILITRTFPDNTDYVTTLKRLVTRLKQADETVTNYYFSKMYLIEACKITGEDAVSCLIDGLNNQVIQERAKCQNFLTPETLYSQFLMTLPDYTVDYTPGTAAVAETSANNWYFEPPEVEAGAANAVQGEERYGYKKDDRSQNFEYRQEADQSQLQFEPPPQKQPASVHSRLDKRFIKPMKSNNKLPLAAKLCSICNKRGHLAKHCRKIKNVRLQSAEGRTHDIFYKLCIVNGHKMNGLLDTGSTVVSIKESQARKLNVKFDSTYEHIRGYGGGITKVLAETNLDIQIDNVLTQVRGMVVPDDAQDVAIVVGEEFFKAKNVGMFVQNSALTLFDVQ